MYGSFTFKQCKASPSMGVEVPMDHLPKACLLHLWKIETSVVCFGLSFRLIELDPS